MLNYERHESEIYVNPFVQLSRLAVTLRVKPSRTGANRHALFIVRGASMGNSLLGVEIPIKIFVGISIFYAYPHILSNQRPAISGS